MSAPTVRPRGRTRFIRALENERFVFFIRPRRFGKTLWLTMLDIRDSFPLKRLTEHENFLSLLHCFGLLGIRATVEGTPRLGIPNQTVKRLLFGHLREAFEDIGAFTADLYALEQRIHEMAYRGAWRPVFDHLADAVARQSGVRDYIAGEKVLQGFLAAWLGTTGHFVFHSERELGGGYAGVCLAPNLASYVDMRHGYVVELKYVKRGERRERAVDTAAARRWRSSAATWPTRRSGGSIPRCGSPARRSCSTAGSWSGGRPSRRRRLRPARPAPRLVKRATGVPMRAPPRPPDAFTRAGTPAPPRGRRSVPCPRRGRPPTPAPASA